VKVEIFDDYKSWVHTAVGALAYFFPLLFIVFAVYELAEWKVKKDRVAGDFVEFLTGCGGVAVCSGLISTIEILQW